MGASNYCFFKSFTKQQMVAYVKESLRSGFKVRQIYFYGSNSSHIRRKLGVFSTKSSFWADVFYAFLTIGFVANDVEETSN